MTQLWQDRGSGTGQTEECSARTADLPISITQSLKSGDTDTALKNQKITGCVTEALYTFEKRATRARFHFGILRCMEKKEEMRKIWDTVVDLKESPLYLYRISSGYFPVIGEGSHDAHIVFVGEAPGESEAKTGRPFCGRSGKFLDEMLASINLDREKVYITNLVKDRPQDNRDPTDEEIKLYAPFLDKQLEIIKSKVIVMLGRHSMNYLFKRAGIEEKLLPISKMHGQLFEGDFGYGTVKLLPLYHPAVALYNGGMKKVLLEDFSKLKEFV